MGEKVGGWRKDYGEEVKENREGLVELREEGRKVKG